MPVYNSVPAYFEAALEGLLAQTFGDFEIILSDNGSDDASRTLYAASARRDPRIRLIRHPENRGAIANFEFVVREARAPFFAWAADDDLHHPSFLAEGMRVLDRDASLVGVGYGTGYVDEGGNRMGTPRRDARSSASASPVQRMLALGAPNGNIDLYGLHRTAVVQDLDLQTDSIFVDWLMMVDLLLHGPIGRVDAELFSYRVREKDLDLAQRRAQHIGASFSVDAPDRYFYAKTALALVARAFTSNARLSPRQRLSCAAVVASVYAAKGWFTLDAFLRSWTGAKTAWAERRFGRSALLAAESVFWSPTFPVRGIQSRLRRL
jgi:glycosyltransferase involved in cell wall biosynthesis